MISVITPVYNGERFIEACIQVVIDQQCPDVEHIIVDGGSNDQTVDIIKRYAERYSHIRWLSEKDQGQSDAMNKGIVMAKGEILAILNVDDYYEPNVLNKVSKLFEALPEPSLLAGNCNVWNDKEEIESINKPQKLNLSELLVGYGKNPFPINPSAYFYHTSLHQKIGLYNIEEHYAMDVDFLFRAVQAASTTYINEVWGNYRRIEGTKTVSDIISGQNSYRVRNLMSIYRRDLPPLQRLHTKMEHELRRNLFRIQYFSKNPVNLLQVIKSKLLKLQAS